MARVTTVGAEIADEWYEWEWRGRGYQLWDVPVDIEPILAPLGRPRESAPSSGLDDGQSHTFVTYALEQISRFFAPTAPSVEHESDEEDESARATAQAEVDRIEIQVVFPAHTSISQESMRQFILSLSLCRYPLSFEIIGLPEKVCIVLTAAEFEADTLKRSIGTYFPEASLAELSLLRAVPFPSDDFLVVDFRLAQEYMLPIRTFGQSHTDPLSGIIGILDSLSHGECGIFQILFQPTAQPWAQAIHRGLHCTDGSRVFVDFPELEPGARAKTSQPLYAVCVRAGIACRSTERVIRAMTDLAGAMSVYDNPGNNGFFAIEELECRDPSRWNHLLTRQSVRSGAILNLDELVSLVHPPGQSVPSSKLERIVKKTKLAPSIACEPEIAFGVNSHLGDTHVVGQVTDHRVRHTHVIGASGSGKSTLLLHMITQDMENGEGVAVLDPHGDLIENVLACVPENRIGDVVLFDPSDTEYPIAFNILSAHSEIEKNILASDLTAVFKRFATSWGDQMSAVLGNSLLAILENKRGGTLIDLRRFLTEKAFRRDYLRTVSDSEVRYFFEHEFPLISGKPSVSILTRLNSFLRPKIIRNMMSQKESRLDFADIMDSGKILLAKLPQGQIGEENSYLLGSLLVTKFHQLVLGRQAMDAAARRPFYLYMDEFHNFATPSMASILSGARKYNFGLIAAHQSLSQIGSRDEGVKDAILSNPYTQVCFRVGEQDARQLSRGFGYFDADDLQNLGTGEALCKIERSTNDFNLTTALPDDIPEDIAAARRESVISRSRERYATHISELQPPAPPVTKPDQDDEDGGDPPHRKPDPAPIVPSSRGSESQPPGVDLDDSDNEDPSPSQSPHPPSDTSPPSKAESVPVANPPPTARSQTKTVGKGGDVHTAAQKYLKRCGEGWGFQCSIEKAIPSGGSVDVVMEKADTSIACEISVTTSVEHELRNLQKCLDADFSYVLMIGLDQKKLRRLRSAAEGQIEHLEPERVKFVMRDDVSAFLHEVDAKIASGEKTVRGYKVKINRKPMDEGEHAQRAQSITRTVVEASRRRRSQKTDNGGEQ